jgi:glycosyltransferase involved in cell wall biosynthesis
MLALSHGRPLIVPDLPAMADLPDAAVLRYDRGVQGLSAAMISAARASSETLAAMSDAARGYAYRITWEDIAQRTLSEMTAALDATPSADVFAQGIGFHR